MPGGRPIGTRGTRPTIREVPGGPAEIQRLFDELASGGTPASRAYKGQQVDLPGGGWAGLRKSKKHGLTLNIEIPGIPFEKVHYK
jgi:hypothetical protein